MIEGTVQVDKSNELNNLYELARRARNDNNSEKAQKYYEQILLMDPSGWEANFYSTYYQSMNCTIGEIQSAAVRICNCEDTVLKLIKHNVLNPIKRKEAVDEIAARLIEISDMLYNAAINHYKGIGDSIRSNYTQEMINNCCRARDICYYFGDYVIDIFGDAYGKDIAVPCWKKGITEHNGMIQYFRHKESNVNIIMDYVSKIQKYEPQYSNDAAIKQLQREKISNYILIASLIFIPIFYIIFVSLL